MRNEGVSIINIPLKGLFPEKVPAPQRPYVFLFLSDWILDGYFNLLEKCF